MIYLIIPTTKTSAEYYNTAPGKSIKRIVELKGNDITVELFDQNLTGLSELMNNTITKEIYDEGDILTFIHDDVEIHDLFFVEKLKKAHSVYDVVGLAGATSQVYNTDKPLVWHLCRESPVDVRGMVSHYIPKGKLNVSESHYNSAYFGPTPGPVVVIDGLFMSMKYSSVKDIIFDNKYTFHYYDMAACVKFNQAKLKIGVWPIFVVHHGLGEFANDITWRTLSSEFEKDYKNYKAKI